MGTITLDGVEMDEEFYAANKAAIDELELQTKEIEQPTPRPPLRTRPPQSRLHRTKYVQLTELYIPLCETCGEEITRNRLQLFGPLCGSCGDRYVGTYGRPR